MAAHQFPTEQYPKSIPPQQKKEPLPGRESSIDPQPHFTAPFHKGTGKLANLVALITGGDSCIGRATAVLMAREGADIAISYLEEHEDAQKTKAAVEAEGRKALLLAGDIRSSHRVKSIVEKVVSEFGKIDILFNNAGEQHLTPSIEAITDEQLQRTFNTNLFSMFYFVQACLPHMKPGSVIINNSSIQATNPSPELLDYACTKAAISAFTKGLSKQLGSRGIRVNAVAPGPILTPLVTSTFDDEKMKKFGQTTSLKRPGQPEEVGTVVTFLASRDASYVTGSVYACDGGR